MPIGILVAVLALVLPGARTATRGQASARPADVATTGSTAPRITLTVPENWHPRRPATGLPPRDPAGVAPATDTPVTVPADAAPAAAVLPSPAVEPVAPPVVPPSAGPEVQRLAEIADEATQFDWRASGIGLVNQYHPEVCCHWGVYDYNTDTLWIGPSAFANRTRLRYVVLHELGHAWQWHSGHLDQLRDDLAPWGHTGDDGLEVGADCLAAIWGAQMSYYWDCPPDAADLIGRRLAGDWG